MTPEVILNTFVIIGAIVGFIALHSSFLLAKTKSNIVTWVYPIIIVGAIMVTTKGVIDIQGYPINDRPSVEFEYLGHVEEDGQVIVVVRIDSTSRVYRWNPTEEEKKALQQGADGKEKGKGMSMRMLPGETPVVEPIRLDQLAPKEGY